MPFASLGMRASFFALFLLCSGGPLGFDVCAQTPVNDDCAAATSVVVNNLADCPGQTVAGTNAQATQDGGDPACDGTLAGYADVWYTFNSGWHQEITVSFDPGTMQDRALVVYVAGCAGTEDTCLLGAEGDYTFMPQVAVDYWLRVYSNLDYGDGGSFSLCFWGDGLAGLSPESVEGWGLFPNPARGWTYLTSPRAGPAQLRMLDAGGRVVHDAAIRLSAGAPMPIKVDQLSQGLYTLHVVPSSGAHWTRRFRVE
jgi:hypothetical protein